jgi:hypothetical protein
VLTALDSFNFYVGLNALRASKSQAECSSGVETEVELVRTQECPGKALVHLARSSPMLGTHPYITDNKDLEDARAD